MLGTSVAFTVKSKARAMSRRAPVRAWRDDARRHRVAMVVFDFAAAQKLHSQPGRRRVDPKPGGRSSKRTFTAGIRP